MFLVLSLLLVGCGRPKHTYTIYRAAGDPVTVQGHDISSIGGGCVEVGADGEGFMGLPTTVAIVCGGVNTVTTK